ncbi:MAG TPA: hypothetical protein PKC43_06760 [Phycisphaerales bacterium]|nr:hypothetical protein [Phycisphaerales bacterium]HMP37133.1 hypothetical protein [Phycisphaerales bacterium]
MSARSIRRFLGLPAEADDRALLGLPDAPAPIAPEQIVAALAERLAKVDRHPGSDGADAQAARAALRRAAERMALAAALDPTGALSPSKGPRERSFEHRPESRGPDSHRPEWERPPAHQPAEQRPGASAPSRRLGPGGPVAGAESGFESRSEPGRAAPSAASDRSAAGASGAPRGASPRPPARHPAAPPVVPHPVRPSPSARPIAEPLVLTRFDRMVLATLVGSGGWNRRSRGRLVALAAQHGVGVDGLVRVVTGLARHARTLGTRIAPQELVAGATMLLETRKAVPSRLEAVVDRLAESVGEELRSDRLGPRIRVSAVFGTISLAMLIVLFRVLFVEPEAARRGSDPVGASTGATDTPGDGSASALDPGPSIAAVDGIGSRPPSRPTILRPRFDRVPNFRGERRPVEALELAEAARALPGRLERLSLAAALPANARTAAFENDWSESLREAGGAWPLLDRGARRALVGGFIEVLRGAGGAGVAERLLATLAPAPGPPPGAIPMWSAAFRAGLLGEIAVRGAVLAPATLQTARDLAIGARLDRPLFGFDDGASAWLDLHLPAMVARLARADAVDARGVSFADDWEAWIEAQRALDGDRARTQRSLAAAIGALLRSGLDFATTGPPSDVLARLCRMIDFGDDSVVRDSALEWFVDPRISAQALWVLTHLLLEQASVRWMSEEMLVDWAATSDERRAARDLVESRWRLAAGGDRERKGIVQAGGEIVAGWRAALRKLEASALRAVDVPAQARLLLLASMLNEAAAELEIGREAPARSLVVRVELALDPAAVDAADEWLPRGRLPLAVRGEIVGPDGSFARSMADAERNPEAQLGFLRQLRLGSGGDLGPVDAEALVRHAFRPSRAEVGSVARAVLIETFRAGPTVVLEMLDQLLDATANEELSQVIAQVTERALPSVRSPTWRSEARRALLERTLLLQADELAVVDALARLIGESIRARLEALPDGDLSPVAGEAPPEELLRRVVDGWRRRADTIVTLQPIPAGLAELDRRRLLRARLATGSITEFVAQQLAHIDLAAYCFAGRGPWLVAALQQEIEAGAMEREGIDTATGQALSAELTLARLWELAFFGSLGSGGDAVALPPDEAEEPGRRAPADAARRAPETQPPTRDITPITPPDQGAPDRYLPR